MALLLPPAGGGCSASAVGGRRLMGCGNLWAHNEGGAVNYHRGMGSVFHHETVIGAALGIPPPP